MAEVKGAASHGAQTTIPCELTERPFERGSVGMWTVGRDAGGSQFFITLTRLPQLDGRYTLFGHVIDGIEVVERLLPEDRILDLYITRQNEVSE